MSSENARWGTLLALKNSPKGKITFDPHWSERGEHILAGYQETLSLCSNCGVILEKLDQLSLKKSSFLDSEETSASKSSTGSTSDLNSKLTTISSASSLKSYQKEAVDVDDKDESPQPDTNQASSPASLPSLSLLSPKALETVGRIIQFQEEQKEKDRAAVELRQELMNRHSESLARTNLEHLKRFDELMELKERQELQRMRDMMERETKESIGRQEKLKEEQRYRIKILNLRVREVEKQRLLEAELEKQRQAEGRERLRNLNSIQEEILQLNQLLEPSAQAIGDIPLASGGAYSSRGNQLCSQVSEVVKRTAEGEFPSIEDLSVAERALQEMRSLIQQLKEEAAKVQEKKKKEREQEEERRKQEELQAQLEAQRKAETAAKEKAKKKGLQNSAEESTINWYKELQKSADQCAQSFEQLNSPKDAESRKLKMELQRAATTPVNQIAVISGSQLKNVFDKLEKLLSGGIVMCLGKSISTSQHPQAFDFVCYKLAEKFVKQAEEQIGSHFEAAFPIGVVASGIWDLYPKVGDLILAHLHKRCPYAVPHYPSMKEGTPVDEYQRILGYCVNGSGVEGQDSFLRRMSGAIRFYAAVIQQRWPYGSKKGAAPHGLDHGWRWLAQMLNMEPLSDITATVLFDFLEVCGNALMQQYQGQFWKLILLLKEEYLPRIEAVTSRGEMGSVIRLKGFLEDSLQSRRISPPKGQLTSAFWRT